MQLELLFCRDAGDLAAHAAKRIVESAGEAIAARGRFTIALAGGSTPKRTYALLAEPGRSDALDWERTFVFFGDERFVPDSDPRSNCGMARKSLLSKVPVPASQIFPIPTDQPSATAAAAAAAYAGTLERILGKTGPRFDLILLGLGEDGHTASLFPGAAGLDVDDAWAVASPPGRLPPPVDRITLTFPTINAARRALFLVSGKAKAPAVRDILEGGADRKSRPAAGVHPERLAWLLDEAAASGLSPAFVRRHPRH